VDIVEILLDHKADANQKDLLGRTPLYYACLKNHLKCVLLLLYNYASPWNTASQKFDKITSNLKILKALESSRKVMLKIIF